MKTLFTSLSCFLLLQLPLNAQQVQMYYENFSGIPQGTTGGTNTWFKDSTKYKSGPYSFRDTVPPGLGNAAYFMTNSMDCSAFEYVAFEFSHICKIPPADRGVIEVSVNGVGGPWTQLVGNHYRTNFYNPATSPFFGSSGYFSSIAYGPVGWYPSQPTRLPDSTWWRKEKFDISSLAAFQPDVRIRFKLLNFSGNGSLTREYGWLIDDINIQVAASSPPVVYLFSTNANTNTTGPINFVMQVPNTGTGCCNSMYMYWSVNGGPVQDTILANYVGDLWTCTIPRGNVLDTICYYFQAIDWNNVEGYYPPSYYPYLLPSSAFNTPGGVNCITVQGGIPLPYIQDFDSSDGGFANDTILHTGSDWQWGTPSVGVTSGCHSPPNCWDIDLNNPYVSNTHAWLLTPDFNLSGSQLYLSFWSNYNMQMGNDGMRLEYELNNSGVWITLGVTGDSMAINWYDTTVIGSGLPVQPGWSGNTVGTWKQSTYYVNQLSGIYGIVRFRFVFDSDSSGNFDGVSIDDFSLTAVAPPNQTISGHVYFDSNANCIFDAGDQTLASRFVCLTDSAGNRRCGYTDVFGNYSIYAGGVSPYTLSVLNTGYWNSGNYSFLCPSNGALTISTIPSANNDFFLYCNSSAYDLSVHISATRFVPGVQGNICVYPRSIACAAPNGQVRLILDSLISVIPDSTASYAVNGDTVTWSITAGNGYWQSLCVPVITSTSAMIGDSVCFTATILPVLGDSVPSNNTVTSCFPVRTSYDPNDKGSQPEGVGTNHAILPGQELTYTIRFQNTGTATAQNIYILDPLDPNLDLNALEVLATSHPMVPEILTNNMLRFSYDNINLPDSNANEPLSHGYVCYRIAPLPGISNGTIIRNTASIYFDYNPAVLTNTTSHTIDFSLSVHYPEKQSDLVSIYPNPAHDRFFVDLKRPGRADLKLYDITGRLVEHKTMESSGSINVESLQAGTYIVQITQNDIVQNTLILFK